jgi:hypothetical protein
MAEAVEVAEVAELTMVVAEEETVVAEEVTEVAEEETEVVVVEPTIHRPPSLHLVPLEIQ